MKRETFLYEYVELLRAEDLLDSEPSKELGYEAVRHLTFDSRTCVPGTLFVCKGEGFKPEYLEKVCRVQSEEYYVNMMIAWYMATALAKQWEATVQVLEKQVLSPWVHNKSIQKACESFRVSDAHKTYLRSLKRSNRKEV